MNSEFFKMNILYRNSTVAIMILVVINTRRYVVKYELIKLTSLVFFASAIFLMVEMPKPKSRFAPIPKIELIKIKKPKTFRSKVLYINE